MISRVAFPFLCLLSGVDDRFLMEIELDQFAFRPILRIASRFPIRFPPDFPTRHYGQLRHRLADLAIGGLEAHQIGHGRLQQLPQTWIAAILIVMTESAHGLGIAAGVDHPGVCRRHVGVGEAEIRG